MIKGRADRFESGVQIGKNLCRLRLKIAQSNHVAHCIECNLFRNIDRSTTMRFDDVRVAKGLRHQRRIDEACWQSGRDNQDAPAVRLNG